jgi:Na+/glutamate symporter|nr:MAG TPA: holin [Caudoviricetes sp.]
MEFLNTYMMPIVVGICLCLGYVIKKWIKDVDNKYIPTLVAVVGIVLALWINAWQLTPEVILSGLVSGLASTGMHQLFKQYIESGENDNKNES